MKKVLLHISLLLTGSELFAQGPPPSGPCPVPPCVPINSNLWALTLLGLLYFTYVFYNRNKKSNNQLN